MLLGHPVAAVACACRAWCQNADWRGPLLLGFFLGWGAIPLVWLLTREKRRILQPAGLGLNPEQAAQEIDPWEAWPTYYHNTRQRVTQVTVALISLLCGTLMLPFPPPLPAYVLLVCLGPVTLALGLQSSYRLPWLGKVWRHTDRIWHQSGLPMPEEVTFRTDAVLSETNLLEEQVGLEAALCRYQKVINLSPLAVFGLIVAEILWEIWKFQHH